MSNIIIKGQKEIMEKLKTMEWDKAQILCDLRQNA